MLGESDMGSLSKACERLTESPPLFGLPSVAQEPVYRIASEVDGVRWPIAFTMKLRLGTLPNAAVSRLANRAIEEGVAHGLRNSDKHSDDTLTAKQRKRVEDAVVDAVMTALSEVLTWD